MARFHFDIRENSTLIEDEDGRDFDDEDAVRALALATGARIACEAFMSGSAETIVIEVRKGATHFLRVAISLSIEMNKTTSATRH